MRDLALLLGDTSTAERLFRVADCEIARILSAPGHRRLRHPEHVASLARRIAAGDLGGVLREPILLGIFVESEGPGAGRLRAIECLDGHHRLLAGQWAGAWQRLCDVPLRGLDARVNGRPAHAEEPEDRWIPLDVARASRLEWAEVPPEWGAKGPTARIPGDVCGLDPRLPAEQRSVPLGRLLDELRPALVAADEADRP